MNNRQIAKNNMYNKMLAFFAKPANAAIWVAFVRLVTEIGNFVTLKGALDLFIQQQGLDTKGVTVGKTADFNNMVEQTVTMSNKAYVWAVDNNNADLTELFDVQLFDFDNIAEEVALSKVMNIRNAINTNIGSMASVNLLPADVTARDGFITAYNASKGTTGDAKTHKETGTKGVADQMHTIDNSLNLIRRLIISQYSVSNPGLVNDLKLDMHIDDLPTRHSGIHLHITDADTGNDLQGALLAIPAVGKTSTSDLNGIAEIIKIKNGDYNVTISAPGYAPETFKTKIVRGKVSSFNIQLSKSANAGGISATLEGDVPSPGIQDIDVSSVKGGAASTLAILVAGSALRFYASPTKGGIPGPGAPFIDVQPGTTLNKTTEEFIAFLGLNDTNKYLTVQNIGMTQAHYTLTFNNLQPK